MITNEAQITIQRASLTLYYHHDSHVFCLLSYANSGYCYSPTRTIPHYLCLIPGNLKALKEWVEGQEFSTVFAKGSQTLQEIRLASQETGMALWTGDSIVSIAKYKALTEEHFRAVSED